MGNKFRPRFTVVNQTLHGLGSAIMGVGVLVLFAGLFTFIGDGEDFLFPSSGWFVLGILILVVGVMIFANSLRR